MRTILLVAIVGAMLGASIAVEGPLPVAWQGHYVAENDRSKESVEVDVFPAYEGQALFIDFKVERSPGGPLLGAVSAATDLTRKQFAFAFADAAGRRGKGTFSRDGEKFLLRLTPLEPRSADATGGAPYGNYSLRRDASQGRSDRHPWSLGNTPPKGSPEPKTSPRP